MKNSKLLGHLRLRWGVLALTVLFAVVTQSFACSTPVYRYAMYRWFPAPYRVIYMHEAEPSEAEPTYDRPSLPQKLPKRRRLR